MTALLMFFAGVALCYWRAPRGDRWHLALCGIAGALWLGMLVIEPRTRNPMFGLITGGFLMSSLRFRRPAGQP